jgi:hypothetical protein
MDGSVKTLDQDAIRGLALGLLTQIYRMEPSDPLYVRTAENASQPRFRRAIDASLRIATITRDQSLLQEAPRCIDCS